ncbi:hypothetical protein DEM27_19845 [Metarhizobium album]|uniref:Uncharacterized protein n=1 Tax=Metarhizobium album TaxID=2182425 RepID=A0A2U2DM65_9HYPH|nr:hypothetical protein [Rhizobium album]PWE54370.1 hypothetical protein DEM27_19845 [Rhizobium album]
MLSELEKASVTDAVHALVGDMPIGVPFGFRRLRALLSERHGITDDVRDDEEFKPTVEETMDRMLTYPKAIPDLQIAPEVDGELQWVRAGAV